MKRTLALVLALVMVLGMMAVPASAEFTDGKEIKYVEAVDVVAACGIIEGFEDGSFDPAGTLTREQAAKVVAYMLLGQKNADALKATSAPFEDVAASRWSAGYIAYVANEGIINGRDEKTFDPTATVTALEFAKLMLGALGYDSAIEEFTGKAWSVNVGKIALDIELFDGNDGADYNAPCTREEAALYILNTLKADLVEYDQKGTNIDLGNGITINTGASKAEVVTTTNSNGDNLGDSAILGTNGTYVYQFAEKYFSDLELQTSSDDFARPANIWTYDKSEVGTYADEPELAYTAAVKGSDLYKALGKPKNVTFEYYVNGVNVADVTDLDNATGEAWGNFAVAATGFASDDSTEMASESKKIGGNGILVEVFEDPTDDTNYIVTIIPSYVGEITGWKAAKGAADEYVNVAAATDAKVPTDIGSGKYETELFSEDDASDSTVVIYTFSDATNEIKSVAVADSVTGVVTSTKGSDGFALEGTSYKYAASKTAEVAYDKDLEDEIEIYCDAYGYVIHSSAVEGETKDVMLVVDINADESWSTTYSAKVVFPGTTTVEIVTLKAEEDYNDLYGKLPAVVEYSKSSGKYVIGEVAQLTNPTEDVNTKIITTGKAMMLVENTDQADIAANSDTVFLFIKSDTDVDDWTYTTYTGIKNVPDVARKAATKVAYIADEDNAYAEFVVVLDPKASQSANEDLYFVHKATISKLLKDADHDEEGYYTVKIYNVATGDSETIELTKTVGDALTADIFVTGYTTDDGLVDEWDELDSADYTVIASTSGKSTLEASKGNLIITGSDGNGTYGIGDDATAYIYDNDAKTVDATSITSLRKTSADDYTFKVVLDAEDDTVITAFVLAD